MARKLRTWQLTAGVMRLPEMQFDLLAIGELIGYSELEGADPSMGVRMGKFIPNENYSTAY